MLHLFKSMKLRFFASIKYMMDLMKRRMANNEAVARIGRAGRQGV